MVTADKIHGRVGHQCVNEFHSAVYICSVLVPVYKISGNYNNIRTALFDFAQERFLSPPEYLILQIRNLQNFIAVEAGRNLPSVCHFCQNQSIILPIKKYPQEKPSTNTAQGSFFHHTASPFRFSLHYKGNCGGFQEIPKRKNFFLR